VLLAPGEALPSTVTVGDYMDFVYGATIDTGTRHLNLLSANAVPGTDLVRVTFRSPSGASWQVYFPGGKLDVGLIDPAIVTSSASGLPYADLLSTSFSVGAVDLAGTLDYEGLVSLDGDDLNRLTELTDAFSVTEIAP